MELSKNICRKTFDFCRISRATSRTGCPHTKCKGAPGRVNIWKKIVPLVPIGTPKYSFGNKNGSWKAFDQLGTAWDCAAHNFSSFHFQEDPRPVPESPEWDLRTERTSSVLKSNPEKKILVLLKCTVVITNFTFLLRFLPVGTSLVVCTQTFESWTMKFC